MADHAALDLDRITAWPGHGFPHTQVGFSRFAQVIRPTSGEPEVGGETGTRPPEIAILRGLESPLPVTAEGEPPVLHFDDFAGSSLQSLLSCPGLTRASTSYGRMKGVGGRNKSGHDINRYASALCRCFDSRSAREATAVIAA